MRSSLACLLILLLAAPSLFAQAGSIDLLKQQVRETLAPALDWQSPDDPFTGPALAALESSADFAIEKLLQGGFFSDIDTSTIDVWARDVQAHAKRLQTLARAYQTPGQFHFQNEDTLTAFLRATAALESLLYEGMPKPGNWWNWEIGLPLEYGPALFLMEDELEPTFLDEALATLRYMIKETPSSWSQTGQNLIWVSFTRLYLGLLTEDTPLIDWAQEKIASTCVITTGEGIQPDFSFHQHGPSLQTGAYGAGLAQDIGVYAYYARGTDWALSGEQLKVWLDYLTHGSRWAIYRNYYEPSTRGRGIVRHDTQGNDAALRALLYGASLESDPDRPLAKSLLHSLETWRKALQPGDVAIADEIVSAVTESTGPVGVKMYPQSDYIVQRGENWLLSIKMLSDRSLAAERYNDEGKQSRHLSSGVHWLVMEGDEWDTNGVRASLDWSRLPGTTTETGLDLSKAYPNGKCYGLRSFVGGMADNGFGVAAMDWKAREENGDSDLTAQKSWFFWPAGMVALGSGITGRNGWPVETTVAQWPMSGIDAAVFLNEAVVTSQEWEQTLTSPLWINADSVSYHFPAGQQVRVQRQNQSGRFIDITRSGTDVLTNNILNMGFDHGRDPVGAAYAYAVLPRHTQIQGDPPYSILRHDENVHAVRFPEYSVLAAAFWRPGVAGPFLSAEPSLIIDQELETGHHFIQVTDPTQAHPAVELLVAGSFTLSGAPDSVSSAPSGTAGIPLQRLSVNVADGLPTSFELLDYNPIDFSELPPIVNTIEPSRTDSGTFLLLEFTRPVDRQFIQTQGCLEIFPYARILDVQVSEDGRSASIQVAGLLPDIPYQLIVNGLPAEGEEAHNDKHWQAFQTSLPEISNVIEVAEDAFVRDAQYGDENFGLQEILTVKQDGSGYWRDTFLKFDLAQLEEPVNSAHLVLYADSSGATTGMFHQIHETDTSWTEASLTWNSTPSIGNFQTSFEAPLPGQTVSVNLTNWVNSSLGKTVSLRIRAAQNYGSEAWLHYSARESADPGKRPQLHLDAAGSPFDQWIRALVPESLAGEKDDPDGDGLPNKIEYAMGLDPDSHHQSPFILTAAYPGTAPEIFIPVGYPTATPLEIEVSLNLNDWITQPQPEGIFHEGKSGYAYLFSTTSPEFLRVRMQQP